MEVGLLNVEGFAGKRNAEHTASRILSLHNLDAAVFTETWTAPDQAPQISGYQVFCSDAPPVPGANRLQGGVMVCVRQQFTVSSAGGVCTPLYQAMTVTIYHPDLHEEISLSGVYVSPRCTPEDTTKLLNHLAAARGGAAIIAGDFNARHTDWDRTVTPRGTALRSFIIRQHYRTAIPTAPTYSSHQGSSVVDFSVYRGLSTAICVIKHGSWDAKSRHRLVITRYKKRESGTLRIPRSVLQNPAIGSRIRTQYDTDLPKLSAQVVAAHSPEELTQAMQNVKHKIIQPWLNHVHPRPPRFRPGWNRHLERKSKERKSLLRKAARTSNDTLRRQAQLLDVQIKREFRRNQRRLLRQALANTTNRTETDTHLQLSNIMACFGRRAFNGEGVRIDPSIFTQFLQRSQRQDPAVELQPFYPLDGFEEELRSAITKGKTGKAPGEDGVTNEMMQLHPTGFSRLLFEVWAAVGRVEYMPRDLREGIVIPLFKKGCPKNPGNYRPIMLLSHMRKAISSAINSMVTKQYQFHHNQWGFQANVGTDLAILHTSAMVQQGLNNIAVLDLKSAYDTVPRGKLAAICNQRLGSSLTAMILPLLSPMTVRTKGQQATEEGAVLTCGVPQGDSISPTLYNIFMDPLLEQVCDKYPNGLSCYADDTIGLGRTVCDLQSILHMADQWAQKNNMRWNCSKSAAMTGGQEVRLGKEALRNAQTVEYLGVSLTRQGTTDGIYQRRIKTAGFVLHQLTRALRSIKLSPVQKYRLFRAHIISRIDYAVPCTPMSTQAVKACDNLEARGIGWCLSRPRSGIKDIARAAALVGFIPRPYRNEYLTWRLAGRLTAGILTGKSGTQWDANNARRAHKALSALAHHNHSPIQPEWLDDPDALQARCAKATTASWQRQTSWANRHKTRHIPNTHHRTCVPALRAPLPIWIQTLSIRWYLYRFPTPLTPLRTEDHEAVRDILGCHTLPPRAKEKLTRALTKYAPPTSRRKPADDSGPAACN